MASQTTDERLNALFRKVVIFQDRNRLELVFETEEEADSAGDFLHDLGNAPDVPARPVNCPKCAGNPCECPHEWSDQ